MKNKMKVAAGISAALAVVSLIGPVNSAGAGHTNAVLETELRGRNEVATDGSNSRRVGDPNGRGEAYVFGIDGDLTTLCYVLIVERIEPATAAHIHRGKAGENGPVVANLAAPGTDDEDAADCLTEGETGKFAANTGPGIVQEILNNPENFYVNVHNAEYPDGAIRGQLADQE